MRLRGSLATVAVGASLAATAALGASPAGAADTYVQKAAHFEAARDISANGAMLGTSGAGANQHIIVEQVGAASPLRDWKTPLLVGEINDKRQVLLVTPDQKGLRMWDVDTNTVRVVPLPLKLQSAATPYLRVLDLNNRGSFVLNGLDPVTYKQVEFLARPIVDTWTYTQLPAGFYAADLNNNDVVAGELSKPLEVYPEAATWSLSSGTKLLGKPAGLTSGSVAWAINDSGWVAGEEHVGAEKGGWVWTPNTKTRESLDAKYGLGVNQFAIPRPEGLNNRGKLALWVVRPWACSVDVRDLPSSTSKTLWTKVTTKFFQCAAPGGITANGDVMSSDWVLLEPWNNLYWQRVS